MGERSLLDVNNVSVVIKHGKEALYPVRGLSFSIEPGEIVGIAGESGCGKTLSALSIPGLLPRTLKVESGSSIHFKGTELIGLSEAALARIRGSEISMIFQDPLESLNPLMKIGKQIQEVLELHHGHKQALRKEYTQKTLAAMEKAGLADSARLFNAYPFQLSGGMRQRVLIAIALIGEPRLIIADEPTTALDVTTQAQIIEVMKRVNQEHGTAILFISHDLALIKKLCSRILVMYAGRIIEEGTVAEVFSHPAHEYTRGLINSIPSRQSKGRPLNSIPGRVPSIEEKRVGCPFAPRCAVSHESCYTHFPQKKALSCSHSVCCDLINASPLRRPL